MKSVNNEQGFVFKYLFLFIVLMGWGFTSINLRGGVNPEKINRLITETERADIVLLQETNWSDNIAEGIRRRMDGDLFYNNSGKKGRGVAFMVKRNVCDRITEIYSDKEGKILILCFEKEAEKLMVCNIHAPNEDSERVDFFNHLGFLMEAWGEMFVMGDFNTILGKDDVGELMVFSADRGRAALSNIMMKHNLVDAWRERNIGKREYSRTQIVKDTVKQSRIDFVLMKKEMLNYVKKLYYKRCNFSDHNYVVLQLDLSDIKRGPGLWHLNTEVLKDNLYKLEMESLIVGSLRDIRLYENCVGVWWDNLKYDIKKYTITYCKRMRRDKIKYEKEITENLEVELMKADKGAKNIDKIIELEESLKKIEESKCKGAMIRSRAKYMAEGERCTRFFFDLEKSRQRAEEIRSIKDDKGNTLTNKEGILKRVFIFYSNLFNKEQTDVRSRTYLLNHIKKRVSEEDRDMCNNDITNEEIEGALSGMKNGRSPGLDGLPCEFYKAFRTVLIPVLNIIYHEVWTKGVVSPSMCKGVIKIIYKKKGDREKLENFRPISLLNCDYKILAKVLANRLKQVLPTIIQTNQAYAVLGRDISDTVNSVRDKIWYMDKEKREGFIMNIDFEKAFDRVEHDFLFGVLNKFNFGRRFIRCLRCLYSDAKSCVKVNGFLTDFIFLTRSIRQGCPLSALLYTLVAEPLGLAINADSGIQGIPVGNFSAFNSESKIYQYADDTTLVLRDEDSIDRSMKVLDIYCKGSGARMNVGKTEFMKLGGGTLSRTLPFKKVHSCMKILGVRVGPDEVLTTKLTWEEVIGRAKQRLAFWGRRSLTLKGKILVLNSLFLSKIWYVLGSVCLPITVANIFKRLVIDFIWRGKPSKVKYETLIGAVEEGGLGLLDPILRLKALRVKTVKNFLFNDSKAWRKTMSYFLSKVCGRGSSALWMGLKDNMTICIPEFYREVLRAWVTFRESLVINPVGREAILNQPLFLNPNLKIGWGSNWKVWYDAGFRTIRDLFYEIRPGLLPFQAFVDDLKEVKNDYGVDKIKKDLDIVMCAIPMQWKAEIQKKNEIKKESFEISFKDGDSVFELCVLKQFYLFFRKLAFIQPVSNIYWSRVFENVCKEEIWGNIRQSLKCPLLENFDFMLCHNCVSNEMRLFKMGFVNSALCRICEKEKEGMKHMFFLCDKLKCFEKKLKEIVRGFEEDDDYVRNNWEKVLMFGAFEKQNKNRQALQIILAVARHTVWVRRAMVRQKYREIHICILFKAKLLGILETLYAYFSEKGDLEVFNKIFTFTNPFIQVSWEGVVVNLPSCS